MVKKLTPVLYVETIEPCLDLWINRLGFEQTVEVPEGDKLGFVILARDSVEVMYQSRASVAKDVPAFASRTLGQTNLYVEVEDLAAVERALQGVKLVLPRRQTFYGSTEIGVQDAAGNVVIFAEMKG
ncbi:MAG: VOC family protein [bacterium]